jgi:peptide chain release factor 1
VEGRVEGLLSRLTEVESELGQPEVVSDQKRYRKLTQEHSHLAEIRDAWDDIERLRAARAENQALLKSEQDPEMRTFIEEESQQVAEQLEMREKNLEQLLVPPDPDDHRNTILELRAGTGGDEAALFVGDCVRMYTLFADRQKWRHEMLSSSPSDAGGYKECVMVLQGRNVHRLLQFEGGTHRVQRVPATEAQGRIHTSAITVAVLIEPDEEEKIELDEKDLRIETCRASGAGGQHVNTTDSAVKITHIPTGLVSTCQDERSQLKNKDKALRILKAKVVQQEKEKRAAEVASVRAAQVGSGDRSERIRTYNFPQNRLTDHRINLTRHNLDRVMDGELDEVTGALLSDLHEKRLAG